MDTILKDIKLNTDLNDLYVSVDNIPQQIDGVKVFTDELMSKNFSTVNSRCGRKGLRFKAVKIPDAETIEKLKNGEYDGLELSVYITDKQYSSKEILGFCKDLNVDNKDLFEEDFVGFDFSRLTSDRLKTITVRNGSQNNNCGRINTEKSRGNLLVVDNLNRCPFVFWSLTPSDKFIDPSFAASNFNLPCDILVYSNNFVNGVAQKSTWDSFNQDISNLTDEERSSIVGDASSICMSYLNMGSVSISKYATVFGYDSDAIGQFCNVLGSYNTADGKWSNTIGKSLWNNYYNGLVMGQGNYIPEGKVSENTTFIVGNGQATFENETIQQDGRINRNSTRHDAIFIGQNNNNGEDRQKTNQIKLDSQHIILGDAKRNVNRPEKYSDGAIGTNSQYYGLDVNFDRINLSCDKDRLMGSDLTDAMNMVYLNGKPLTKHLDTYLDYWFERKQAQSLNNNDGKLNILEQYKNKPLTITFKDIPQNKQFAKFQCVFGKFGNNTNALADDQKPIFVYSKDNGQTWEDWDTSTMLSVYRDANVIMVKAKDVENNPAFNGLGRLTDNNHDKVAHTKFCFYDCNIDIEGNINWLISNDGDINKEMPEACFCKLFESAKIDSAKNLIIPSKKISKCGCREMFSGSKMTSSPLFLAEEVSHTGCRGMFKGCSNLTSVQSMFVKHVSGPFALQEMFSNCTSLLECPKWSIEKCNVSGTDSAVNSFGYMYSGCSKIKETPYIDAKCAVMDNGMLLNDIFKYMFQNCSNLEKIHFKLGNAQLTLRNFEATFQGCPKITEQIELPQYRYGMQVQAGSLLGTYDGTQVNTETNPIRLPNVTFAELSNPATNVQRIFKPQTISTTENIAENLRTYFVQCADKKCKLTRENGVVNFTFEELQ